MSDPVCGTEADESTRIGQVKTFGPMILITRYAPRNTATSIFERKENITTLSGNDSVQFQGSRECRYYPNRNTCRSVVA